MCSLSRCCRSEKPGPYRAMFSIKPTPVLIDRQGQTGYWNGCGKGQPSDAQGNVVRVAENLPGIPRATPLYSLLIIQGN